WPARQLAVPGELYDYERNVADGGTSAQFDAARKANRDHLEDAYAQKLRDLKIVTDEKAARDAEAYAIGDTLTEVNSGLRQFAANMTDVNRHFKDLVRDFPKEFTKDVGKTFTQTLADLDRRPKSAAGRRLWGSPVSATRASSRSLARQALRFRNCQASQCSQRSIALVSGSRRTGAFFGRCSGVSAAVKHVFARKHCQRPA
ncbi:hypothetical protein B4Q13_21040, partial [Lacticaseibacillus rhamnosus]